jgi:hypothetical protein
MDPVKELIIDDIKAQWPEFEKYFEENKDYFKKNGYEDLINAIRWRIAFSRAEQISEESLRDIAHTIKDGSYGPVPTDLEELQQKMAWNNNDFEDFKGFYSNKKKENE